MSETTPALAPGDKRRPCRHCGQLRRPKGLKLHESSCPKNPERRPAGVVAAADPPAEKLEPAAIARRELFPPRSAQTEIVLSILQAGPGDELATRLRPRYLAARARDFGILEVLR